ncbi:MAG: recombinase family protein [Rectinemataceae bacterium]|jgi:site-specific DNA recombinase
MVGCYIRVSTLQQKDNYSVETQRERAILFANKLGEQYELYDETGSGKNLERPEFIRLLKDVESKKLSIVWVIEASRLTRDVEDAQTIKRILKKNKVELYVNDQHVDLSTSESILSYNITSAVSEYERSKIIDRVVRSRRKQIDDGEQTYCSLYGYDYTYGPDGKKIWQINDTEAAAIRLIFAWYEEGLSYNKISNRLIDSGYVSKRGGQVDPARVRTIIRRPEYYGMMKNTKGRLVESKVYPPILEHPTDGIIQRQTETRERVAKNFREAKSVIAGLPHCRACGAPYYLHRSTHYLIKQRRDFMYVRYAHLANTTSHRACKNTPKYIDAEMLENFIEFCYRASLRNRLELQSLIEAKEKEIFLAEKDLVSRLDELKSKLGAIEQNRKKLIAGVASGLYTNDDIADSIRKLNDDKANAKLNYDTMHSQLEMKQSDVAAIIRAFADKNIEVFESANADGKRDIYCDVVRSFEIDNGWVYLTFITGREYSCPIKQIPAFIAAVKRVGEKKAFATNRYRWGELE